MALPPSVILLDIASLVSPLKEIFILLVARSNCSAASATKETPAIAAFSHLLYSAEETTPYIQK